LHNRNPRALRMGSRGFRNGTCRKINVAAFLIIPGETTSFFRRSGLTALRAELILSHQHSIRERWLFQRFSCSSFTLDLLRILFRRPGFEALDWFPSFSIYSVTQVSCLSKTHASTGSAGLLGKSSRVLLEIRYGVKWAPPVREGGKAME